MTTWNSSPSAPPDPNKGDFGQQEGGYPPPPQRPYPGTGDPNASPAMYPGGMPPAGYPPGSKAPYGAPYGKQGGPYGGDPDGQPVEGTPLSNKADMSGTSHSEDPEVKDFGFSEESIRKDFLRKVYSILALQLFITGVLSLVLTFETGMETFVETNPWLFIVVDLICMFAIMIVLARYGEMRRKYPANYIMLAVFTLAESFMLAVIASVYHSKEVFMAVCITAGICMGLSVFASSKWDYTPYRAFVLICFTMLMFFGIEASNITGHGFKVVNLIYECFCGLLCSIYFIYDTQKMVGGKHKYSISPEECIFAVLNLYVDIIDDFAHILSIIGTLRR